MIEGTDSKQKMYSHSVNTDWLDQTKQKLTNESVQQLKPELIEDTQTEVIMGLEHLIYYENGTVHPIKTTMTFTTIATLLGLIIMLICYHTKYARACPELACNRFWNSCTNNKWCRTDKQKSNY